ncbi:MAG TPA: hypothetical protein PKV40_06535, partial [Candidatus Kapabacteria bacterium]|nr:hypothetical protein [Candidatus Kapabacteria bacterium]
MRFWQKYRYTEYLFGQQAVIFAVSDSYSELFQNVGIETDIFMLESVKKDLNTEEGSYAIDELPFSINHLACQNENDEKALYFVLDATNIKVNRYCGVFFGEDPTLENMLFLGKISSKVSGTDKLWIGEDYDFFVNPKREYKFSAYSFDISILDQVKLTGKIENSEGVPIKNVYERFENENWASVKNIFQYRLSYSIDNVINNLVYFCPLGNLYKVIKEYLLKASAIIYELTNTALQLNLLEGSLGIQTSPVSYTLAKEYSDEVKEFKAEQNKRIELRLSEQNGGDDWSSPFIHRKMIDPALGNSGQQEWQKNQISSELAYSFKNIDNVSDLLFEIARSFGCYLFVSYTSGTSLNLEFKSRKGLIEDDYTYLIGTSDANFDTSSIITKETNEFYGLANNYAVDEFDDVSNKPNTNEPEPSIKFQNADKQRKFDKEKKGIESERLLLTTSITRAVLCAVNDYGGHFYYHIPLNVTRNNNNWETTILQSIANAPGKGSSASIERIHTGIYIKTKPIEPTQIQRIGLIDVWRPAAKIFTNINGTSLDFDSLSKYVNYILARDKQYYETEYSLTVPYWNAFSKNADGSNSSWRNIKLGSKVKIAETVKRFHNGNWLEEDIQRDFVVVGIEINLQKPETKLKLHSLERFAYGWWEGNEGLLPLFMLSKFNDSFISEDSTLVQSYEIEEQEEILAGDAVMLLPSGRIAKSKSKSIYQNKTFGIAKQSGSGNDIILVQISGRVVSDNYAFSNIGGQVYARTNLYGINITENILDSPNVEEDMVICLGTIDSPNSFILEIVEFPYESGVLQQP